MNQRAKSANLHLCHHRVTPVHILPLGLQTFFRLADQGLKEVDPGFIVFSAGAVRHLVKQPQGDFDRVFRPFQLGSHFFDLTERLDGPQVPLLQRLAFHLDACLFGVSWSVCPHTAFIRRALGKPSDADVSAGHPVESMASTLLDVCPTFS
jgi:hypothetical protein